MSYIDVRGVIHEVTCEHFESSRDGNRSVKLDLNCGGHVFVEPDIPWKHEEEVVTCFWCIVNESRWRFDGVSFKGVVCK